MPALLGSAVGRAKDPGFYFLAFTRDADEKSGLEIRICEGVIGKRGLIRVFRV